MENQKCASSSVSSTATEKSSAEGRLFVGGLDPTVTEFIIKKTFEKFGELSKV
jgi:RNA recognition motif-containing protein